MTFVHGEAIVNRICRTTLIVASHGQSANIEPFFLKYTNIMNLNKLRNENHSIAKANGWHEQEHSDIHCLMLIIIEIAKAVRADRKNLHADVAKFKEWQGNTACHCQKKPV